MPSRIEEPIVDPKVAEYFALLRLDSQLRVAKNDEKIIIGDCPFVFVGLKGHFLPKTDNKTKANFTSS